jgi:hypothetical protein
MIEGEVSPHRRRISLSVNRRQKFDKRRISAIIPVQL